ncbi:SDR family NAD(P)-dependent oxidoreductase [Marinactinospora thermotolerans]|uniref:Short-chain dehydrogenase n=1 Tax=Marinactinospora thermotolerans DSM 45154 TaxID=1122192 RepID=A0A1T4T1K1_9ACTN|nr:SDR family oxidoreductase [Marinactinospora thermotolerans]SKA34333.1 hypothetical protein SAMN02745673_04281 [Marinactinospora thermotolerans DSM 45154]
MSPNRVRTALITGASSGIGEEYARQLAQRGFSLVLVARRGDRIADLAAELTDRHGVRVESLAADLAEEEGLLRVEERLRADGTVEQAPVDLLVNNAGRGASDGLAGQDVAAIDGMIELNVRALTRLTRAVLPVQIDRREAGITDRPMGVINVASMAGLLPASPLGAVYAATKAYVVSFSESVALEAAPHGLKVTVVLPGFVRTDMTRSMQESGAPDIAFVPKERVVTDSLRAWAAGMARVVPGPQYRAASWVLRAVPHGVFRGIARRMR